MWYLLGFIIILIVVFVIKAKYFSPEIDKKLNRRDKLKQLILDNVKVQSNSYIDETFTKAIAIDEQNKKVHLFSLDEKKCLEFNFADIIQSEIVIDNNTVITSNRGKQLLGGVVGGLIAGVPGAIIGGLSSGQKTSEKIKNVELKLTLSDMNNSIFKISFLKPLVVTEGHSKDFYMIKNALNEVEKWQGYFNVILKQHNKVI